MKQDDQHVFKLYKIYNNLDANFWGNTDWTKLSW